MGEPMKELISVIIPVYNVQDYLRSCVDSIRNQTYTNLEIILVDDGSTDDSGVICEQYAEKDNRIRVLHKPNGGQSSARNMGIDRAEGRWLTFVDSDDLVAPDMIEKMHHVIGNGDIVMCDRLKFTETPVPDGKSRGITRHGNIEFLQKIYDAPRFIAIWGKLYRRELFENFRFAEGIIYEDEDALPQLIYAAQEIVYLQEAKYYYRVRPESTMTSGFGKKRLDIIVVCRRRIDLFTQWGLMDLRKKAVKDYYHHLKRLEQQTADAQWGAERALVQRELEQWPKYGVRFSLYERLRQHI